MTIEVLVIGAIRIVGSLPVLRWPLAGGLLATPRSVTRRPNRPRGPGPRPGPTG